MKYFFFLVVFLISLNIQSQTEPKIDIVGPNYLYKLSGTIANLEIDMCYQIFNNNIRGYYYYRKYRKPINIVGHLENDSVYIYELDKEANKNGLFKGVLVKNSTFNGTWINLKTNKELPLKLTGNTIPFKSLDCSVYLEHQEKVKFYSFNDSLVVMPFNFSLLNRNTINGYTYFLFKIGSSSNPYGNGNGYCGSGYEEKIVLIKTDRNLNILKQWSYLINSCYSNYISDQDNIQWKEGRLFQIKGEIFKGTEVAEFLITYDNSNPDLGLKIQFKN